MYNVCAASTDASPTEPSRDQLVSSTAGRVQAGIQLDPVSDEHSGPDEAKTDGLAIVFVDEKDQAFYGETSNVVFVRFLLRAVSNAISIPSKDGSLTECNTGDNSHQTSLSFMKTSRNTHNSPSTMPSAEEMDALLDTYFSVYGTLFPFIHEPTFRETYNECKASAFTKARRTWLGLLNMTFAMASNVDLSAEVSAKERFRKSSIFFARAASLCDGLVVRTVSLDIVQYLLLDVLYLQGTQRSVEAWNVHGILVRTAIALGLHSEKSGQGLGPILQETRRRTWLTIYCLDNLLSITYGRTPSIPVEHIVVQLPSPWISPPDMSRQQSNGADTNTEFLKATVRLHQIMGRSVADQYGMNLGIADQDMDETAAIQVANTVRQELRRWTSSLPPELALCKPGSEILSKSTDLNRLRVILTLRHHFASILIHRPLLYATLRYLATKEGSTGNILPYRINLAMAEAQECIRCAENTIEIVHSVLSAQRTGYDNLGVWFFTLFYVFTSSLVVLGRSILAQHGVYLDEDAPGRSVSSLLAKAVESLDKLDKGNDLVNNCARFIKYLAEKQGVQAHPVVADHDDARDRPNVEAENDDLVYERSLSTLVGLDLDISQSEMFDPFLDDLGFLLRTNDDDGRKRRNVDSETTLAPGRAH
ncbi:hypothetical protein NM208_g13442 [Fusarium decemcellulare]|uniref:Uncharacterized protein n=1 Tax=Fusarium decemcellulare TaxID=57161 RepID=A0ACC1RLS3_9HYPO|nr:hypothetical protein NM208_g13442 [Fusarium decemcellulare]